MSPRRILAIARRIAQGFRRDERTLGLMFVVPLVVTALEPVPDPSLRPGIPVPPGLRPYRRPGLVG